MNIKELNEYQELANRTAKEGSTTFNLTHAALGIAGEAGELTDAVKKHLIYGQPLDQENVVEELGDLLWFIALACETLEISMAGVATLNIEKLRRRYPEQYSDELAAARLDKEGY